MDITFMLTAFGIVITLLGSNIALISWFRADMNEMKDQFKLQKIETDNRLRQLEYDLTKIKKSLWLKEAYEIQNYEQITKAE